MLNQLYICFKTWYVWWVFINYLYPPLPDYSRALAMCYSIFSSIIEFSIAMWIEHPEVWPRLWWQEAENFSDLLRHQYGPQIQFCFLPNLHKIYLPSSYFKKNNMAVHRLFLHLYFFFYFTSRVINRFIRVLCSEWIFSHTSFSVLIS